MLNLYSLSNGRLTCFFPDEHDELSAESFGHAKAMNSQGTEATQSQPTIEENQAAAENAGAEPENAASVSVDGTDVGKRTRDEEGDGGQAEDPEVVKKYRSEQVIAPSESGLDAAKEQAIENDQAQPDDSAPSAEQTISTSEVSAGPAAASTAAAADQSVTEVAKAANGAAPAHAAPAEAPPAYPYSAPTVCCRLCSKACQGRPS